MVKWERSGGSEGILLSGVCITKKKRMTRGTYKGKRKESGSDNGKALGDRKKEIQKGLGKANVAVRQISMNIYVLRSGYLGLESEGRIRETGGEVY